MTLRDHFVSVNGCVAQSPTSPSAGSKTHLCTTYSGCSSGHSVEWCAFDGDHTAQPLDGGQATSWLPARVSALFTQF